VSKFARNVIDSTRFGFDNKYPRININGIQRYLHDVAFETYYPELYAAKKSEEMILHKFDDQLDFRPHSLRIGTRSENAKDAHDNGCYSGTKSARMKCCSYVDDVFEKLHESQDAAVKYLQENGYPTANGGVISETLNSDKILKRYDRTWSVA
jgi:hypothetical protein